MAKKADREASIRGLLRLAEQLEKSTEGCISCNQERAEEIRELVKKIRKQDEDGPAKQGGL